MDFVVAYVKCFMAMSALVHVSAFAGAMFWVTAISGRQATPQELAWPLSRLRSRGSLTRWQLRLIQVADISEKIVLFSLPVWIVALVVA